jgi:iron(III) transport system ATP-binding protein
MSIALRLASVAVERHGHRLLDHVDLHVEAGSILALTGPSGSGKTTLLRTIVGLDAPTRGQITLDGRLVSVAGRVLIRAEERNAAIVFQDLGLWPHMTVSEHLQFALTTKKITKAIRGSLVSQMLKSVGLHGKEMQRPATLSGGERQRLALARALVSNPSLILFDEPLSNIDVVLKGELIELLSALLKERRTTAVFVTHDPREVLPLTNDFAVLERGRIVQRGTIFEMNSSPATIFVRALCEHAAS